MTRIAFISNFPPEPIINGSAMRIYGLLDQKPDEFDVMRIYPESKADKYPPHASFNPVRVSRLREYFSMVPKIVLPYLHASGRDEVLCRIIDFDPRLVVISGIHVFPMVPPGFPILYDAHNVEWHLSHGVNKFTSNSIAVRFHRMISILKLRMSENALIKRSDFLVACSDSNAEYFTSLRGKPVPLVYNGTDMEYWSIDRYPEKGLILFPGDMSYHPNIDAAEFIVREVLPILREKGWNGKLVICGRNPDLKTQKLSSHDVVITGSVDDMRNYYQQAEVLLAPLRIGSGTPLKVITALAAGLPVITMSRVARSLGLAGKGAVLQADSPDEMATQVLRLMDNHQLAQELACRGITLAEEKYSWNAVGRKFWAEVQNCLDSISS